MSLPDSKYDVTNDVKITDSIADNAKIDKIFSHLYPQESASQINQALCDATALWQGKSQVLGVAIWQVRTFSACSTYLPPWRARWTGTSGLGFESTIGCPLWPTDMIAQRSGRRYREKC